MATQPAGVPHFLACLERRVRGYDTPFPYWLLDDILPESMIDAVVALPFTPPVAVSFDGRREGNHSTRVYFSPENQRRFEICRDVAGVFGAAPVIGALERLTRADLSEGQLRIEYCLDTDGFWLEPHLDISVKFFTMLIYLSDDPNLRDAGTDIYDATSGHRLYGSVPYEKNKGLIFIPGAASWHGFTRRPIRGLRKSLIINYVSPAWRNREELAFP